jgi:hypothetical protein
MYIKIHNMKSIDYKISMSNGYPLIFIVVNLPVIFYEYLIDIQKMSKNY